MEDLINEVVKIVGAALATALVALVVQLLKKVNIQIGAERQAQLETVALEAVLMVEEQASAIAKAKLKEMLPHEKFNAAISHVVAKVPGVTPDEAAAVVNAQLPQVRAATASFATAVLKKATRKGGRK